MRKKMAASANRALLAALIGILLIVVPHGTVRAEFDGYGNYATPGGQNYVVMPEVTGGWFDAIDYFPDNGSNDTIGSYETRGRALVANDRYIYMQKNYGTGAGSGTWSPGDDHGYPGHGLPGGHANWVIVAEVTPGVGESSDGSMDPSFIHISPDGATVALGMGYAQPMLVFPVSMLDPGSPPLLNSGTGGNTPASGVTLFPWGTTPMDGVQYYEAEWVPDPESSLATLPDGTLDPSASTNNTHLAINTDRGWDSGSTSGDGSVIEVLDTTSAANRPVVTIQNIGYAPKYSASADLTVDRYGNLITGQGYDYNNPVPGPDSETGQIKIFAAGEWMGAYSDDPSSPSPIEYNHTSNIIADNVLSAAAMGVDKDNNLHVGGGDVVSGLIGETGFASVIHAYALNDALDNMGPVDETDAHMYKELQPDANGDDSATFAVYNPWAQGIVLIWNPRNFSGTGYGPYDGWYTGVQPIATTYYDGEEPDGDGDGIPDGSDNAFMTPNPGQQDTDGDGWANAADADYNNDGKVLANDYAVFRNAYRTTNDNVDMTGDGRVLANDYARFRSRYRTQAPFY